jgi:predicted ester cyclase
LAEDAVEHPLNPAQVRGREPIKQVFGGFHVIVPDLRITIEDVIAEADKVAVRSTIRGTPTAPFLGVPPSGRPMTFGAIDVRRIADGRVVEGWHVEDFVGVLLAWTALPPPRVARSW